MFPFSPRGEAGGLGKWTCLLFRAVVVAGMFHAAAGTEAQEIIQAQVLDLSVLDVQVIVIRARPDDQVQCLLRDAPGRVRVGGTARRRRHGLEEVRRPGARLRGSAERANFDPILTPIKAKNPDVVAQHAPGDGGSLVARRAYVLEMGSVALQGAARDLRENADIRRAYLGEGA